MKFNDNLSNQNISGIRCKNPTKFRYISNLTAKLFFFGSSHDSNVSIITYAPIIYAITYAFAINR